MKLSNTNSNKKYPNRWRPWRPRTTWWQPSSRNKRSKSRNRSSSSQPSGQSNLFL